MHRKFLIPGGAAPEVELTLQLTKWAKTLQVQRLHASDLQKPSLSADGPPLRAWIHFAALDRTQTFVHAHQIPPSIPFATGKAPAALAKFQCGHTSQTAHVDHGWSVQQGSATVTVVVHACQGLSLPQAQAPHTLLCKAGADTPCPSPFLYLLHCSLTALTAYKLCSGGECEARPQT